jgi:broad specificity phosphatase PhoE
VNDTPKPPDLYTLTLLRHGESTGNVQGIYQGQADYPLSERGKAQVASLARRWQIEQVSFDLIVASPLVRAQQTAAALASALNSPMEVDEIWMERNNGRLEGMRVADIDHLPRLPVTHPYLPQGETGESLWDLYLRAGQALSRLLERPPMSCLVVSHGGMLNLLLYAILGLTPQANFQGVRFTFRNTAFVSLTYDPQTHLWRMHGLNDYLHCTPLFAGEDLVS